MGDMQVYGYGLPMPIVDHPHERFHQHQPFWSFLAGKRVDQKLYPNHPDVDIRDAFTEYMIDIEVPGIKDSSEIECRWTSLRSLVVSGATTRPDRITGPAKQAAKAPGTRDATGDYHLPDPAEPYVLLGERRIGPFERHFNFPIDVETELLEAQLEAGLLKIRVPKKGHTLPKGDGKISVKVEN